MSGRGGGGPGRGRPWYPQRFQPPQPVQSSLTHQGSAELISLREMKSETAKEEEESEDPNDEFATEEEDIEVPDSMDDE